MMNKYTKLWQYLKNKNECEYLFTFDEIKDILGFPIDHSFLTYKKEANDYGYEIVKISLKEKTIKIKKLGI